MDLDTIITFKRPVGGPITKKVPLREVLSVLRNLGEFTAIGATAALKKEYDRGVPANGEGYLLLSDFYSDLMAQGYINSRKPERGKTLYWVRS